MHINKKKVDRNDKNSYYTLKWKVILLFTTHTNY